MINRRILHIDTHRQRWHFESLQVEMLQKDPRQDYFTLSGETLCQYVLRRTPRALVIARGPLAFLSGNKISVGYISPLTGAPHYSFVGGRAAAQLLNLGLDAICFHTEERIVGSDFFVVVSGRAPEIRVDFKPAADLPQGQRSAYYWLLEQELGGDRHAGSIFTLGEGARLGYRTANLAVEAIYHAGRGGAGSVFARHTLGLVLRGKRMEAAEFFHREGSPTGGKLQNNPDTLIAGLLEQHCKRFSGKTGGTIVKLFETGANPAGKNTLPSWNARRMGYPLADLGGERALKTNRAGQTGCHWCRVDCRHWHWVPADYAPGGKDVFLDDFEPAYAVLSMLGLEAGGDDLKAKLALQARAEQSLILPIEQMGCDVMDIGLGLAALLEGVERGLVPTGDVPEFLTVKNGQDVLHTAGQAIAVLRSQEANRYPALKAVGDGPQALAELYPSMQAIVFTSGKGTLGNPGHCNTLWTFLMPFSRFFGHLSGQYYKIDEKLPPPGSESEAYRACFERVVSRMFAREAYWLIGNALSQCAFTFVIFSDKGDGERLSDDHLLVKLLALYGIHTSPEELAWFSQAFWAQSIDLKCSYGWRPAAASDFPRRVYEGLSLALDRPVDELQHLMELLVEEWKRQAAGRLERFGYQPPW